MTAATDPDPDVDQRGDTVCAKCGADISPESSPYTRQYHVKPDDEWVTYCPPCHVTYRDGGDQTTLAAYTTATAENGGDSGDPR